MTLVPALEDRVAELTAELCAGYPEEADAIRSAIALAARYHQGQIRKSGDPFVLHPLCVSKILMEQGLSGETLIAGILHDVIEDTECGEAELREKFGDEVAQLVQGATKIVRLAKRGSPQREKAATYRKLLIAASEDARVLVLKLADRLHNIRTINHLSPSRQQAIAKETLEVYAPLAHRLGMNQMKEELEDRSLAVLDPRAYQEAGLLQEERRGSSGSSLEQLMTELRARLEEANVSAEVYSRVKNHFSINEKLKRRGSREEILDVLAMRIIVETVDECYRVLGVVHALWPPRFDRFHDYIAVPKANLYQSLHTTIIGPQGQPVEIQIRTKWQHEIAERGIAAHWLYKETLRAGGPAPTRKFLDQLAESQNETPLDEAFAALKQDVFEHEVYVFTPEGDIRILPEGSCAIDFAYSVHTELGHCLVGVRINGELRPITRPLKNGEVVEVIASKKQEPSRDWLEAVVTSRARYRIRQFHQAGDERGKVVKGMKLLGDAARSAGLGPLAQKENLADALQAIGYQTADQAALEAARDNGNVRGIVHRLIKQIAQPEEAAPTIRLKSPSRRLHSGEEQGVVVEGLDGVMVRLAHCCAPEPADAILGYVSLQRGVSVHRKDCRNTDTFEADRMVSVRWTSGATEGFRSELRLVFRDRPGILTEIGQTVYEAGAELTEVNFKGDGVVARGTITCWVNSPAQSEDLRRALGKISGKLQVERR